MSIVLVLLVLAGPAAAQDAPAPPIEAVRACVEAAERDTEAERACIGVASTACIDASPDAQTTVGMMQCAMAEAEAWDTLLDATYDDLAALAAALGEDEVAAGEAPVDQVGLLGDAQRAWTTFRDADCAQEAGVWGEGSMRLVAGAQCRLTRTAERALELIEKRRAFENP